MKLVFLHGAGNSGLSFYYQLRHFRNSKAIELPGHPTGKACTTIDGYLEWVRGFNAARRYKDVVLCGHSMGGAIALLYALRYPEELRGIILIGTGARLRVHPDYLHRAEEPGEGNLQWLEGQKEYYEGVEADIYQVLVRRATEVGPEVELNDLRACDNFDVMDRVQEIQLPTQVVCGSEDIMTPVKYSDYLAHNIKHAREEVIPGAGHFVQLQRYQDVNEQIERFMTTLK
ncbi:MAG: alpha/beta hydrolase [Chloroflexi bacterium]|nr:alpha/beta hydrolase [Chloroflexota bacterium]MCH8225398.1 alpha/beta hydrolase [Chloroflexota bacterium]MCI0846441.1 alpha/beta hydrolase [Chloroflexota bacterium]